MDKVTIVKLSSILVQFSHSVLNICVLGDEPEDIDIMDKFLELAGAMIVKRVKKAEISKSDPNSPSKETDKPE